MKKLAFLMLATFVAAACSSTPSGSEICDKVKSLCPAGGSGDGGVTITITCDPAKTDTASNKDEIKTCLDSAKDCSAATACLLKAKQ